VFAQPLKWQQLRVIALAGKPKVFIPFQWVFGRGRGKKGRDCGEIKHIFFALLNPPYIDLLWLY